MNRKYIRTFLLVIFTCTAFTGYIKGCNSPVLPKQYSLPSHVKDSLKHAHSKFRDSTIKIAPGLHYERSSFHEFFFGSHYRDLWSTPVKMNLFDIGEDKGGLKVLKLGGSMQTLNLRLKNKEGKEYVLRSIDKDQSKALPGYVKNKITSFIIRDQTAALHPYGALVIPKLAEAANIYHTTPELVFIPFDKRLGDFADEFEGRVALLEESPDESWAGSEIFGHARNILSTTDMLYNRYNSQEVEIDERSFAKARLFDLLINDWDRHVDQWRWAEFSEGKKKIYRPIPRDRDAAFYKFSNGLLPQLVLVFNPKFQSFDHDFNNLKGLVKNARYLDGLILNSISEKELLALGEVLRNQITDKVIEEAVQSLPPEVYEKTGGDMIARLKSRRDQLPAAAEKYYALLFEEAIIVGTDCDEKFKVERLDNGFTSVTVEDEKSRVIYRHVFDSEVTERILLYGLKGADEFELEGKANKGIMVEIYGGEDRDEVKDRSFVSGYRKKTKVYDFKNSIVIEGGDETEDKTSYDPEVLYFNRTGIRKQ